MHNPGEMNSERHYFALIGDIIDSRHEQDRYDVQKKLQSILSTLQLMLQKFRKTLTLQLLH